MQKYMLIARDIPQDFAGFSPEDMQKVIEKYVAWGQKLKAANKLLISDKLTDGNGRVLRGSGKAMTITDGPFSEAKEVVGGFWILSAKSYDEAVELAKDCPHLEFGQSLEVRAIENL